MKLKHIERLIDIPTLQAVTSAPIASFAKYGTEIKVKGDRHFFQDNGSNILGIAHLDTTKNKTWFTHAKTEKDMIVFSPSLDDRLGAYIILHLLPSLGVKVDWLLTEGEETGRSTGADFSPPKKYNWMFQFDRRGTGVVMYFYETPEMRAMAKLCGWSTEMGSFSDISKMAHVGCKGFNFGTGYHDEHDINAYAIMSETLGSVFKFVEFHKKYKNTLLEHDSKISGYSNIYTGNWRNGYSTDFQRGRLPSTGTGMISTLPAPVDDPKPFKDLSLMTDWIQCPNCGHYNEYDEFDVRNNCERCNNDLDIYYASFYRGQEKYAGTQY